MSTRLIQIVAFANVAASATVALPHSINVNGTPRKPDFVAADVAGFTVAVTATQVSVTNNNAAPASVNVWLELKHTIPRELGALTDLVPQPFVASAGSSAGPSAAAGPTGDGTLASPRYLQAGSFAPTTASFFFEDLFATANVSLKVDAAPSEIQQFNSFQWARGALRLRPQSLDGSYATVGFAYQSGPGQGSGWSMYAINGTTHAFWQFRATSPTQLPQPGDDFNTLVGMLQDPAVPGVAGHPVGVYFQLNDTANGNGNWWVVIKDADLNVRFTADTGLAADFGSLHTFGIEYTWPDLGLQGDPMTYTFFLDGVQVGTFSADTILFNDYMPMIGIGNNVAGQAAIRVMYADYFMGWSEENRTRIGTP